MIFQTNSVKLSARTRLLYSLGVLGWIAAWLLALEGHLLLGVCLAAAASLLRYGVIHRAERVRALLALTEAAPLRLQAIADDLAARQGLTPGSVSVRTGVTPGHVIMVTCPTKDTCVIVVPDKDLDLPDVVFCGAFAHEIGHFVLGHTYKSNVWLVGGNALSDTLLVALIVISPTVAVAYMAAEGLGQAVIGRALSRRHEYAADRFGVTLASPTVMFASLSWLALQGIQRTPWYRRWYATHPPMLDRIAAITQGCDEQQKTELFALTGESNEDMRARLSALTPSVA